MGHIETKLSEDDQAVMLSAAGSSTCVQVIPERLSDPGREPEVPEDWDRTEKPFNDQDSSFAGMADFVMTICLLILWLPAMLVAMALIRMTSPGPVIYQQVRVGRRGRLFTIYKLRTMWQDCERHTGPQWATLADPRVTPIGRLLRQTHIDELPQLWNVLKGDMSLVGPRPERPEFVSKLHVAIPRYRRRESVRPGVTGLAQVQLPPDTDHDSVRRKLACDLHYIRIRDFWLDLRIVMVTALVMVGIPGSLSCRWLRIPLIDAFWDGDEPGLGMPATMTASSR